MLLFSCVFVGASIFLTAYLGSIGFILANSLNMLVRALKRWVRKRFVPFVVMPVCVCDALASVIILSYV